MEASVSSFNHKHYVPILKSRAGEFDALSHVGSIHKSFTPLIELTPVPLRWIDGQADPVPAKTAEAHVDWLVEKIKDSWEPGLPIFIDGRLIESEDVLANNSEVIEEVLNRLAADKLQPIPVLGLDRVAEYTAAAMTYVSKNSGAICLRITASDIGDAGDKLSALVTGFLKEYGLDAARVHLLVDYGPVLKVHLSGLKLVIVGQLKLLAELGRWKTFTVAGSGFPEDLSEMSQYSLHDYVRTEWLLWLNVNANKGAIGVAPTFGDYAVTHPEYREYDPRQIRMSPKIKYSDDIRWVVAKGEAIRRKKDPKKSAPPTEQYPALAKMIMAHQAWKGPGFSWGDGQIEATSKGDGRSDMQTWVTVGTVHHIVFCAKQIASLPSP
jgi:hypothetical protein